MTLKYYKSYEDLIGEKVTVHRNLHTNTFSVSQGGKVRFHNGFLALKDVEFRVRPGGYKRYLETGQRNVHAFASGILIDVDKVEDLFRMLGREELQVKNTRDRSLSIIGYMPQIAANFINLNDVFYSFTPARNLLKPKTKPLVGASLVCVLNNSMYGINNKYGDKPHYHPDYVEKHKRYLMGEYDYQTTEDQAGE